MATSKQVRDFIDLIAPLAVEECRKRGYGYPQAFTCVSQACCESAYGTSELAKNANALFGIKANGWKGKVYSKVTKECYDGNTYVDVKASFRAYGSFAESVEDYFNFIEKPRYRASLTATTVKDCITAIKNGGYATSPTYVSTILTFYERHRERMESYREEKKMSVFSPLTTSTYDFGTKKSNPRTKKVCKITPHHTAGTASPTAYAKNHRDTNRQASANYYIRDDVILGGVSEDRRAWTSGGAKTNHGMTGRDNDFVAITFEVSNSKAGGDWPISDKSYRSLVRLCADICKRYDIVPHWDGTSKGTITTHDLYSATGCPGPYLKRLITSGQFEKDILAEMGKKPEPTPEPTPTPGVVFRVQIGAFKNLAGAQSYGEQFKNKHKLTYTVKREGAYYKVLHPETGFTTSGDAELSAGALRNMGYKGAFVVPGGA